MFPKYNVSWIAITPIPAAQKNHWSLGLESKRFFNVATEVGHFRHYKNCFLRLLNLSPDVSLYLTHSSRTGRGQRRTRI
jgi:hypothetical protein